jgi:hypothetical protein
MAVTIEFRLPARFGARHVQVAGDFTAWAPLAMEQTGAGDFRLRLGFDRGQRVRYRFLVDGERWMNEPGAAEYMIMPNGSSVSVMRT